MDSLFQIILSVVLAAWDILLESSLFVLFGFFVAGLLKGFIPDDFIQRHLGGKKKTGILKASLFGVPIPLCSCGVIPAAGGLRQQGAGKGAVTSFMISTPETGVDSIAVTYALLDPIMTVVRPVAAFFTAIVTGLFVNIFDKVSPVEVKKIHLPMASNDLSGGGACCSSTNNQGKSALALAIPGAYEKFKKGMAFSFGNLLGDIGPWLLGGIVLAAVITVFISPEFISDYLGGGIFSMAIMILLATPLYVCATASTPIAAALALKGLSPGAALVFLLAGPATNVATITVVSRLLGKKTAVIYVSSIMFCSLMIGLLVNWLYLKLGLSISGWVHSSGSGEHGMLYVAAALILLLLIGRPWVGQLRNRFMATSAVGADKHEHRGCHCRH